MTTKTEDERRVVVVYIGEEEVLEAVLFDMKNMPRFVKRAKTVNIPEGVELVRVYSDWSRRAFGFLLRHDSFAVVPECDVPPTLDAVVEWEVVDTDLIRGDPDVVVVS